MSTKEELELQLHELNHTIDVLRDERDKSLQSVEVAYNTQNRIRNEQIRTQTNLGYALSLLAEIATAIITMEEAGAFMDEEPSFRNELLDFRKRVLDRFPFHRRGSSSDQIKDLTIELAERF